MLGWTNGLFHKRTLVKIGMSEGKTEKYMEQFDKIIQSKEKVNSLINLHNQKAFFLFIFCNFLLWSQEKSRLNDFFVRFA